MKTLERLDSVSMGASSNGAAIHVESMTGFSIMAKWTGSPVGDFTLEASNNAFTDNVNNNENPDALWVTITGSDVAAGGTSGNQIWNVSDVYYKAVRVVYTRTSGTGTYTAAIWAKGLE